MPNYLQIHAFAIKYKKIYESPKTTEAEVSTGFAEQCLALGFDMNRIERFGDLFLLNPSYTPGTLSPTCISSVMRFGDAIFYRWGCMTHGTDFAPLLVETNRKWFLAAFDSLSVMALEAYNYQFRFEGVLQKIQLTSCRSTFWLRPSPTDEAMQRLTILANGRVWLSKYNYGNIFEKYSLAGKQYLKIEPNTAKLIFRKTEKFFCEGYDGHHVTDVGTWDLILTNADGRTFKTHGSVVSGNENLDTLSEMIRIGTGRRDLMVFDGNAE